MSLKTIHSLSIALKRIELSFHPSPLIIDIPMSQKIWSTALILAGLSHLFQSGLITNAHADVAAPQEEASIKNELIANIFAYKIQNEYPTKLLLGTTRLGIGYGWFLNDLIEFSGRMTLEIDSNTDQNPGKTQADLTVGPTFNFAVNKNGVADAFFVMLGLGFNYSYINAYTVTGTNYSTGSSSSNNLAYHFEFGKRFKLLTNVSWVPTLLIYGFSGADIFNNNLPAYPAYTFIPVRISILF